MANSVVRVVTLKPGVYAIPGVSLVSGTTRVVATIKDAANA